MSISPTIDTFEPRSFAKLFIGGEWVEPTSDSRLDVISPATEERIATVPEVTLADVDRAVSAARNAFDEGPWPRMSGPERTEVMRRALQELELRNDEVTACFTAEVGSPVRRSQGLQDNAWMIWSDFAEMAASFEFEDRRSLSYGEVRVIREPVGVVGAITPWNGPSATTAWKVGAALAAGCTLVVKPAPEAPLELNVMAEAFEAAGFPPGVISVLPGGRDEGEALVANPMVDKITLTGSTAAGRKVMSICAERIARVTLELGGKSAAIVADDVDFPSLLPALIEGGTGNTGQVCCATTRVLVSRERHDEMAAVLAAAFEDLRVGDPWDPATEVGPLVSERQRSRVEEYIKIGLADGAEIVAGGGRPRGLEKGWYFEPTLFVGVDNSMRIAREEVFGPVVCLIPYDDIDDAISIANDSDYGLLSAVFTHDESVSEKMVRGIRAGQVNVNGFGACPIGPFGGFKQSGLGREGGPEGLAPFLEPKLVNLHPDVPLST